MKKNIEDIYPLSPLQQGMLFHRLYNPESDIYFGNFQCTLSGQLNVEAFKQAWQQVVNRHPVFRTAFIWEGVEQPLQVVCKQVNLPWRISDWRSLTKVEQQKQLEEFLQEDSQNDFVLEKAPLTRFALMQLDENYHYFVWSYHHLFLDGWSVPIVFKEVFAFYEAFKQGKQLSLPVAKPYRNYIAWLQQQDLEQAQSFWKQNLDGFTAPTPLNLDSTPEKLSAKVENFEEYWFKLPESLTKALSLLAKQERLTLNTLIQGSWAILLSRYSRESDIVFGTTVAGRPTSLKGIESMVGMFINTIPVRVKVTTDTPVLNWLQQFQTEHLKREEYFYTPLVDIQKWSEVPNKIPLFESLIVFENHSSASSWSLGDSSVQMENIQALERTNYPLTIVVGPQKELLLKFTFDNCRFKRDTIACMAAHWQTLLAGIVANPQQRISELSLLTEAQRHQILTEWNNTQTDYPKDKCIHQLFEEQVAKTPNNIAVVFENQQLTYQQLNEKANQLAHYLQKLGVKPETLVGICIERSLEMIVGLLGILKAGGAYLPLAPNYPQQRLQWMLEDAEVSLILTTEKQRGQIVEPQAQLVCLDTHQKIIQQQNQDNLNHNSQNHHLAYVMYTSGSTGKPKGVCVIHQGVVRLVKETNYASFTPEDVFLQLAPISFDASTLEIWASLLNGSKLIVMPPQMPSLEELGTAIKQHQITTLWLTAGLFNLMVDERANDLKNVRQLLTGGDVVSVSHVHKLLEKGGKCRIINGYGPTENTTFTCCYPIEDVNKLRSSIPIGQPIANTQVYILDSQLNPTGIGIPGELYIGGDGLARGYLNRPDLNGEKFIPHPFSNEPETRLYKTGDLAKYLPDGKIEFLGRIDNQVKIRGFRVELGEIEAYLSQHPFVKEAVVNATTDQSSNSNKHLIAYIVTYEQKSVEIDDLRFFVKDNLPDYMIPSAFIILEKLPLNPNGKIDRFALPQPELINQNSSSNLVIPRDYLELQLTKIWEKVLKVSPISIQDSFFDLGGHSLLAIQLISQIKKNLDKSISLATLFESPTIEQLANLLRQEGKTIKWSSLIPLKPYGSKPPLFLVPPGGNTAMGFSILANHLEPDQPVYGLQYLGMDGEQEPLTTVEETASYYLKEIQTIQPEGPYYLGGKCSGGIIAYEMAQQLLAQGQEVALLAMLDILSPPRLAKRTVNYYLIEILVLILTLFKDGKILLFFQQRIEMLKELLQEKAKLKKRLSQSPDFVAEVYYTHIQARKKYITTPYPGNIFLVLAQSNAQIMKTRQIKKWEKVTGGELEYQILPVDHDGMMVEPQVKILAEVLKPKLKND